MHFLLILQAILLWHDFFHSHETASAYLYWAASAGTETNIVVLEPGNTIFATTGDDHHF